VRRIALAFVLFSLAAAGFLAASVSAGRHPLAVLTDSTSSTTETTGTETTSTTPTTTTTSTTPTTKPKPKPRPKPATVRLARRVTVGGVHVGGLTPKAALAAVRVAFASPLVVTVDEKRIFVAPRRLGAKAYVNAAVARATRARSGASVRLVVTVNGRDIRSWVAALARANDRDVRDAHVVLQKLKPKIVEERFGLAIRREATVAVVAEALRDNRRGPVKVVATTVAPAVKSTDITSIIVIRRGSNRLMYYRGEKIARTFTVATGQSIYPTPLGSFEIVQMWRDPWWYPPPSPWAQGAKPIPPGPGNPLGTRWMGLSAPAVGIHGTPDAASLGYSASHGCIRMAIPSAEWLFDHVQIGTPVVIVAA
jgi:lipoprotein-anchoring transpeptidase ErfK/SrfK